MGLSREWTDKRKTKEDKDEFQRYILNSGQLLDRLAEMLERRIVENSVKTMSDDFTSPSWAMLQAHLLGQNKAYSDILKLLDRGTK